MWHFNVRRSRADCKAGYRPSFRNSAARERLTRPQRLVAEGLVALADSAYPVACGKYRELLALDTLDFRGWFGLQLDRFCKRGRFCG